MNRPVCFVIMPFGTKTGPAGNPIDFDSVYSQLLAPAIVAAGMQPLRADEEKAGGIIHKPMFERLILCDFAIADVSIPNANVYYELGIRHATRPSTTIAVFQEGVPLPFDVALMRAVPYVTDANGVSVASDATRRRLTQILADAKQQRLDDSPVFQLLDWFAAADVEHAKTDDWAQRMQYAEVAKAKLRDARRTGLQAIRQVEAEMGDLNGVEAGILIDLMLSYRQLGTREGWAEMARLPDRFPEPLRRSPLVQEQLALALNRIGEDEAAEAILTRLIEERGPSSETNGLLGRVYKDRYRHAREAGKRIQAQGALVKAIDTYLQGFENDWRDAYPGINAVTLMEFLEEPDSRQAEILPVVRYAVERRLSSGRGNYWDYATLVELAVLADDPVRAERALSLALACTSENNSFSRKTTAQNLLDIQNVRDKQDRPQPWVCEVIDELRAA